VSWRPYQRAILAERQDRCHYSGKTADNDVLNAWASHGDCVGGRTMNFTASIGGLLRVVMIGLSVAFCRCLVSVSLAMIMTAGIMNRFLNQEAGTCIAMKSSGTCIGEKTRLKSGHDQKNERQHRLQRRGSSNRDSVKSSHGASWDKYLPDLSRPLWGGNAALQPNVISTFTT
jgi:hypothetical protein